MCTPFDTASGPVSMQGLTLRFQPGGSKKYINSRVGVICNCNIKINSNLSFFNVIASNQLLSG